MSATHEPSPARAWLCRAWIPAVLLLVYAITVHALDLAATLGWRNPIDFRWFRWTFGPTAQHVLARDDAMIAIFRMPSVDAFKFAVWFVLPLLFCLPRIDRTWFGVKGWKRIDLWALLGIGVVGLGAVLLITVVPGLRDYYVSLRGLDAALQVQHMAWSLAYILSWLVGWEFLHRYALLTRLDAAWPRYGWLLIPVLEGAYHVLKHPLEIAGMVAFSIVLTAWARRRKNALLPFLAHLAIEVELVLFMLYV